VNSLALAALIQLQPQAAGALSAWIEESFEALLGPADERLSRGWSVGGGPRRETLVQSRPPRPRPPGPPRRRPPPRPPATAPSPPTASSEAKLAASLAPPSPASSAGSASLPSPSSLLRILRPRDHLRREIEAHLPGYLARSRTLGGDRELLVLAALAHLDPASALGKAYVDPSELRRALRQLDQQLGSPPTIHLMISDGRSLGVLHRGGRGVVMQPPILRPARALADTKPQSVALLLALNVDAAVEGAEEVGEGILTISRPSSAGDRTRLTFAAWVTPTAIPARLRGVRGARPFS
jgi:hypothetical protein